MHQTRNTTLALSDVAMAKSAERQYEHLLHESALHVALAVDNGSRIKVTGNTQEINDWPDGFQRINFNDLLLIGAITYIFIDFLNLPKTHYQAQHP